MNWENDREWVLSALRENKDDLGKICEKLDKLIEAQWKLNAKVAGIAGLVGLLSAGLTHFIFH